MVVLSACTPEPVPGPEAVVSNIPLRNPTAPIASQADATLARLQGSWTVILAAGIPPGSKVRVGEGITLADQTFAARDEGLGRMRLSDGSSLWVHWIDIGDRTAVIGDPEGARVWVMDKTGRPGDRMKAAREILKWYGYDMTRLRAP